MSTGVSSHQKLHAYIYLASAWWSIQQEGPGRLADALEPATTYDTTQVPNAIVLIRLQHGHLPCAICPNRQCIHKYMRVPYNPVLRSSHRACRYLQVRVLHWQQDGFFYLLLDLPTVQVSCMQWVVQLYTWRNSAATFASTSWGECCQHCIHNGPLQHQAQYRVQAHLVQLEHSSSMQAELTLGRSHHPESLIPPSGTCAAAL